MRSIGNNRYLQSWYYFNIRDYPKAQKPLTSLIKKEYKKVMKEYIAGLKANKSTQKSDEIRVADKQKEPEILTYHNKEIWKEISEALVNFFDG